MYYQDSDQKMPPYIYVILMVAIGIIIFVYFLAPVLSVVSEYDSEFNNGEGQGLPLAYADSSVSDSMRFTMVKSDTEVIMDGTYADIFQLDNDMVVFLADNQAVYIYNGQLRYFDGTEDNAVDTLLVTVSERNLNDKPYAWLYYPHVEGGYRAYSDGVEKMVGEVVAIAHNDACTVISKGDTVTSSDKDLDYTVTIGKDGSAVDSVKYSARDD